MNEHNTYPVFVADQVLTADHLNQVVGYLDEQNRLTRNRLIGIGIVCGLEIKVAPDQIIIGKGCGVTSEGYLILHERKIFSYYRPYSLPEYFSPEYKPAYEHWQMWELLNAEESLEVEDPRPLAGDEEFLEDKIVVLLLEMKEKPLKNCVEIDCEDKGEKIEFRVKPLLVPKEDLDAFMEEHEHPESPRPLSPVPKLRRFNVPARALKNTNSVFKAFLDIVNENALKQLAQALNTCYEWYGPVLGATGNPFAQVASRFTDTLSHIKTANPFFIQYFYDWIDDLVKAVNELDQHIFDLQVTCCPDQDQFPLHLMLGEAASSTPDQLKAPYRHHFLYSPLFDGQRARLEEAQLLFRRLVAMVETFKTPDVRTLFTAPLKITPSRYLYAALSKRCMPYYYDPAVIHPVWSWDKTRRGRAKTNLSYHAAEYSTDDAVVNPLNYDTERLDFFRVEGHIGKPVTAALETLITQRDEYNLPFDIAALSTATISAFFRAEDHECHFKDLESLYQVLLAEMKCKFGEFECKAAKIPYQIQLITGEVAAGNVTAGGATTGGFTHMAHMEAESQPVFTRENAERRFRLTPEVAANVTWAQAMVAFRPGDFLKSHCPPVKGTVGEVYLQAVANGTSFGRTGAAYRTATGYYSFYALLFSFIHSVEQLIGTVWEKGLDELDIAAFEARYREAMDAAGDLAHAGDALEHLEDGRENDNTAELYRHLREIGFYELATRIHGLLHICLDDRLRALKAAYRRRLRELQLLTNLLHYARKHPGMEHKAGVPKGGTFIIVYHETPSRKDLADLQRVARQPMVRQPMTGQPTARQPEKAVSVFETVGMDALIRDAYVNEPKLLRSFEKALNQFMGACNDMDDNERERIRKVLTGIPREEEPLKFRVPEEAVIADFYLPYICCSDCAPISYVMPAPAREKLSIDIDPTEFCNDDQQLYPVKVSPAGGELTASSGGLTMENGYLFSPFGLKGGTSTLTYTLADGRSTSIDLLVAEAFQVGFRTRVQDHLTVQFIPGFPADNREVLWDFGDGTTSTEFSPSHTYQFADKEASFIISLRVTNSPCVAEATQTITLTRPVDPEFRLQPGIFCVRDRNAYEFDIAPFPKTISEISNKGKLQFTMDTAAKKLSFVPAKHRIKTTRDYHLEYQGIPLDVRIVVPDASFIMQIKWLDVDNLLILKAKEQEASDYRWTISQGANTRTFKTPAVEAKMSELKLNVQEPFSIMLTVNHQLPSGNCAAEQKFSMTPALFRKYQASGDEFDNTTKE